MSTDLKKRLSEALLHAASLENDIQVQWTLPRHEDQGDLSTNLAMILARDRKISLREFAADLLDKVDWSGLGIERAEVAGPGFINVWIGAGHYRNVVAEILEKKEKYGASDIGSGTKINVEFVSANPTGPLNIVSGRAAAIGDSLVKVLNKAGYKAKSEFYVNDVGQQIYHLGESVIARALGEDIPDSGYYGENIIDLLPRFYKGFEQSVKRFKKTPPSKEDYLSIGEQAADMILFDNKDVLDRQYNVTFNRFFHESELYKNDAPKKALERLRKKDAVFEKDGATWFAGSKFGDEDRVIITSEGRPTYLLPDIAYHLNKAERGFDKAIDLLGPDHLDYVGRMQAAMKALDHEDFLEVIIVQQVHLISGGEKVKMSKRAGKIVTLERLVNEVGCDVARYFFLQRKTSSPLEFDLDLAKEQSERNPVFYVQYAHTRICGILRQDGCPVPYGGDLSFLKEPEEINLIKHLESFGEVIERAAESREPQKLVSYLHDLATTFHKFYTAHRVVGVEADISAARAALSEASRIVLAEGLNLLGVSTPDRM